MDSFAPINIDGIDELMASCGFGVSQPPQIQAAEEFSLDVLADQEYYSDGSTRAFCTIA